MGFGFSPRREGESTSLCKALLFPPVWQEAWLHHLLPVSCYLKELTTLASPYILKAQLQKCFSFSSYCSHLFWGCWLWPECILLFPALPLAGTGDCITAFLCIIDLSIIYRSRPLSVLRKPMGCGHGWPRARRISVCSNCSFCYIFPLGPVNWSKKLVKCSHPRLLIYGFRKIKTRQKLGRLCLLFGTSLRLPCSCVKDFLFVKIKSNVW